MRRMEREKNVGGSAAYILFNGYTYERKERRKRISVRRKMLNKQRRRLFNQQQRYYREFIYKSKANNFYSYKNLLRAISLASASSNSLASKAFNSFSNSSFCAGLLAINALYSARNALDFSRYSLNGVIVSIIYYSFRIVNKFLSGLI